jgi:hypothetical protein
MRRCGGDRALSFVQDQRGQAHLQTIPARLGRAAALQVFAILPREQQIVWVLACHLLGERICQKRRERHGAPLVRLGCAHLDLASSPSPTKASRA